MNAIKLLFIKKGAFIFVIKFTQIKNSKNLIIYNYLYILSRSKSSYEIGR